MNHEYEPVTEETAAEICADIENYFKTVTIKEGASCKPVRLNTDGRPFGEWPPAPRLQGAWCHRCGAYEKKDNPVVELDYGVPTSVCAECMHELRKRI